MAAKAYLMIFVVFIAGVLGLCAGAEFWGFCFCGKPGCLIVAVVTFAGSAFLAGYVVRFIRKLKDAGE